MPYKTNVSSCCGGNAPSNKRVAESQDEIRAQVSRAYANAISGNAVTSRGCCSTVSPAGVAAQSAGYRQSDAGDFAAAAGSSFGCGNPLAFAGVEEGQTVIDLGSGAGLDLLLAGRLVGDSGRVIGIDMTDAMIDAARANVAQAGASNIEVRKGLIEDLPVEDASVDWVISNCVINLSPEKNRVFAEIARVLKPGGRFSISDIVADGLPDDIRRMAAAYSACVAGAISEKEYLAGLAGVGLTDLEVSDRLLYDDAQIRGMIGGDLEALGVPADLFAPYISRVVGRVWSAKIRGRRP